MRSHFYSFVVAFAVALAATVTTHAQTVLFQSQPDQHIYYRIPAIASHGNTLWAFGDDRSGVTDATAWGDIGSVGNISLLVRKSTNRGRSWTPATVAVQGHGIPPVPMIVLMRPNLTSAACRILPEGPLVRGSCSRCRRIYCSLRCRGRKCSTRYLCRFRRFLQQFLPSPHRSHTRHPCRRRRSTSRDC